MACGTPVLGFRKGSVPEVIDDGVTGYVVDSVDEAMLKFGSLLGLDRGRVRRRFEERFTAARMAHDYVGIYESQMREIRKSTRRPAALNGKVLEAVRL
jgi:glycosyltransferase involved in cell wall biosynthesis